jgi:ribosomal protein S18 acetylase RimI-like enzyme
MYQSCIKISENDIEVNDVSALNRLLRQLNPDSLDIGFKNFSDIMQTSTIITLRDTNKDNVLVGMGMLLAIRKLYYSFGSIEEVVVDKSYRGLGLGKAIVKRLVNRGRYLGMKYIALTSSPDKIVANKLYQSIGFKIPRTNLYRFYY